MKNRQREILEITIYVLIVCACVFSSVLFANLPFRALDTGVVYGGF